MSSGSPAACSTTSGRWWRRCGRRRRPPRFRRRGARQQEAAPRRADVMASCASCSWEVQLEDTFCARCGATVSDPLIGAIIGEGYRVVGRIGVGGMGAVYRGEHTMMRRDLAIKVLLPELGGKEGFARRFEREAESASRLAHPNIIAITDFGHTPEGSLFLVMEYLAGDALSAVIKQGPIPVPRALHIVRQML